jgi:Ca2+-binding EF-hand superfamily protein
MSLSNSVNNVLDNLRRQLAARGARGIIGLSRRFRSMDDDGSQSLSYAEFRKAVRESGVEVSDEVCSSVSLRVPYIAK